MAGAAKGRAIFFFARTGGDRKCAVRAENAIAKQESQQQQHTADCAGPYAKVQFAGYFASATRHFAKRL